MGNNIWVPIYHLSSSVALREAVIVYFKTSLEVRHITFFEIGKEDLRDKINLSTTQTLPVV